MIERTEREEPAVQDVLNEQRRAGSVAASLATVASRRGGELLAAFVGTRGERATTHGLHANVDADDAAAMSLAIERVRAPAGLDVDVTTIRYGSAGRRGRNLIARGIDRRWRSLPARTVADILRNPVSADERREREGPLDAPGVVIAAVPRKPSFAFNLPMGRAWPPSDRDLDDAETVARELGLGELLDRMPAGLMQLVGEGGWQLSHGERSRLFMARALLQGGEVMLLDESFAALDPRTLRETLQCVLRRAPTLMVIAHP